MEIEKQKISQEISPAEIKRIRKSLGLSQTQAGELLGGGTSAFAKYENGSVKPSAALVKMLKFLRERPEELLAISGRETRQTKSGSVPFDVTSEHISALSPRDFSALIEKLLSAEAQENNLPLDRIHVASRVTAPDGGEDARIEWQGGPERTDFLPNRFCQFQLKTGNVSPSAAGKEILSRENKLKPMIRAALEKGASYIMLCSRTYTRNLIEKREDSIRRNLGDHGFKDPSVQFRDSDQIASWVNCHPCVAVWLLRKTRSDLINPFFGNWKHWSKRSEHDDLPLIDDSRLPELRRKLRALVTVPRGVARVVGPGGVGKSRLVLEALGSTETEKVSGVRLSDLVLYAFESEIGPHKIKEYAWNLANSGKRVVLVVDRCSEQTCIDLVNIAKHSDSRLSLVTISSEIPRDAEESKDTVLVRNAGYRLIERIVESVDPNILEWDRQRIVEFSEGDIRCARIIAGTWHEKGLTASVDEELVRELIGYHGPEPVYEVAGLISVFGGVATKVTEEIQLDFEQFSDWLSGGDLKTLGNVEQETEPVAEMESELEQVARFAVDLPTAGFHRAVEKLKRQGTVHQYGDRLTLEPKRIAVRLAELRWKEWEPEKWEEILVGPLHESLRERVASRLALLNMKEIAEEVAGHICASRRFWSSPQDLTRNSVILGSLADANPEKVANLLEDILDSLSPGSIQSISDDAVANIVGALSRIAFVEGTFESVAGALLKLACGEDEIINEGAAGRFISLFPVRLACAADGPEKRLRAVDGFLQRYGEGGSGAHMFLVVSALLEGAKIRGFHRDVGQEIHGSRPSRESWEPKGYGEFWDYVKQCASRLVELAKEPDETGEQAREGLGHLWSTYILDGLIDDVERWTREINEGNHYWPGALRSFEALLKYDGRKLDDSVKQRIRNLVGLLEPDDLEDRVELLIKGFPRDRPEGLEHLSMELLGREDRLKDLVLELCGEWCGGSYLFGRVLAERAADPLHWKQLAMETFESVTDDKREPGFLIGYMEGLEKRSPEAFWSFKRAAAKSPVFAPLLPRLTSYSGISSEDVDMVIKALREGLIHPEEMSEWVYAECLSELPPGDIVPLFDALLRNDDPSFFGVALDLIRSYTDERKELLEHLRPQLRQAAVYPSVRKEKDELSHTQSYEILMNWILSKGSEDADARAVAITIVKQLSIQNISFNDDQTLRRLLPSVLSNFSETVWPLIGQAIRENPAMAGWFAMSLREKSVFGNHPAPILSIPENTLFGWCYANPEIGPQFLAGAVPVLKENGQEGSPAEFHPIIKRLLDEFGQEEDVLKGLEESIKTFTWSGPRDSYFARYREPIRSIREHEKETVRRWARKMLDYIDNTVNQIRKDYV